MFMPSFQSRIGKLCTAVLVLCGILISAYYLGVTDHFGRLDRPTHPGSKDGFHYTKPANVVNEVKKPADGKASDAGKESGAGKEHIEQQHRPFSSHPTVDVVVPEGVKVIALIFFGRKEYVTILDCYLRRNLKINGGLLDEVVFAVNTKNETALEYLDELIATTPQYSKHEPTPKYDWWIGCWEAVQDPEAIYFKIDDDVVYIEDNAIPSVVKRVLESPQYFAVSANVVNNPALAWVHYNMGVYKAYWPEMSPPKTPSPASWHASELPAYTGPDDGPKGFNKDGSTPAPFKGHRWLPVRKPLTDHYDLQRTPASTLTYDAFGPSLKNWAATAQTHYSFLEHLEDDDTWRYKFDKWDYQYERLSINFLAIRGKDILDCFPFPQFDDEDYLTRKRSKQLGRHVIVDGGGLVVHFSFNPQFTGHEEHAIGDTDLLSRYALYAEENICVPILPPKTPSTPEIPSTSETPSTTKKPSTPETPSNSTTESHS